MDGVDAEDEGIAHLEIGAAPLAAVGVDQVDGVV